MIFFLFQPREHSKAVVSEMPILELKKFSISELDVNGLKSIIYGTSGIKYKDRYIVENMDYTDNASSLISNIKADNALYKGVHLYVDGNVTYIREGGLVFKTPKAEYNTQTSILLSLTGFRSEMDVNKAIGSYLEYNNAQGITNAKNVTVTYQLKERK